MFGDKLARNVVTFTPPKVIEARPRRRRRPDEKAKPAELPRKEAHRNRRNRRRNNRAATCPPARCWHWRHVAAGSPELLDASSGPLVANARGHGRGESCPGKVRSRQARRRQPAAKEKPAEEPAPAKPVEVPLPKTAPRKPLPSETGPKGPGAAAEKLPAAGPNPSPAGARPS